MKKTILALFIFITIFSKAQTIKATSGELEGLAGVTNPNNTSNLVINNNQFLFAASKQTNSNVTLTLMDKKYKTLWSSDVIEDYIASAIFDNNILVVSAIYGSSRSSGFSFGSLRLTLLKKENGKKIAEKELQTFPGKTLKAAYVLTDTAGNFKALVVRNTSSLPKAFSIGFPQYDDDYNETTGLQVFTLDNNIDAAHQHDIDVSSVANTQFIGTASNGNGNIFFVTADKTGVTLNEYSATTFKLIKNIKAPLNFDNKIVVFPNSRLNVQQNTVLAIFKLGEKKSSHSTFVTAKFNVEHNKAFVQQDVEDKDYLKQYDAQRTALYFANSFIYKDKLIIMKEGQLTISTNNTGHEMTNFSYGPIVISIYDSNLHNLKDITIDEKANIWFNSTSAGFKIIGNKLYVFYNYYYAKLHISARYQVIDLDDYLITDKTDLNFDLGLKSLIYGPSIVWFDNIAYIPVITNASLFTAKINTEYNTVQFK